MSLDLETPLAKGILAFAIIAPFVEFMLAFGLFAKKDKYAPIYLFFGFAMIAFSIASIITLDTYDKFFGIINPKNEYYQTELVVANVSSDFYSCYGITDCVCTNVDLPNSSNQCTEMLENNISGECVFDGYCCAQTSSTKTCYTQNFGFRNTICTKKSICTRQYYTKKCSVFNGTCSNNMLTMQYKHYDTVFSFYTYMNCERSDPYCYERTSKNKQQIYIFARDPTKYYSGSLDGPSRSKLDAYIGLTATNLSLIVIAVIHIIFGGEDKNDNGKTVEKVQDFV